MANTNIPFEMNEIVIKNNNCVANFDVPSSKPLYKPMVEFLKNCPIAAAFTKSPTKLYINHLQEFWYTTRFNREDQTFSFTLLGGSRQLSFGLDTFRTVAGFDYLLPGQPYTPHPTTAEAKSIFPSLGYVDNTSRGRSAKELLVGQVSKTFMTPTWRILLTHVVQSLGPNTGSYDQLNTTQLLITHGLITGSNLDFGRLIFDDLASKVIKPEKRSKLVPYTRFLSLVFEHLLGAEYARPSYPSINPPKIGAAIYDKAPSADEVPLTLYMKTVSRFDLTSLEKGSGESQSDESTSTDLPAPKRTKVLNKPSAPAQVPLIAKRGKATSSTTAPAVSLPKEVSRVSKGRVTKSKKSLPAKDSSAQAIPLQTSEKVSESIYGAQQATSDRPSLEVAGEDQGSPQPLGVSFAQLEAHTSGHAWSAFGDEAAEKITSAADPSNSAPNDSPPQQQGDDEGPINRTTPILYADLERTLKEAITNISSSSSSEEIVPLIQLGPTYDEADLVDEEEGQAQVQTEPVIVENVIADPSSKSASSSSSSASEDTYSVQPRFATRQEVADLQESMEKLRLMVSSLITSYQQAPTLASLKEQIQGDFAKVFDDLHTDLSNMSSRLRAHRKEIPAIIRASLDDVFTAEWRQQTIKINDLLAQMSDLQNLPDHYNSLVSSVKKLVNLYNERLRERFEDVVPSAFLVIPQQIKSMDDRLDELTETVANTALLSIQDRALIKELLYVNAQQAIQINSLLAALHEERQQRAASHVSSPVQPDLSFVAADAATQGEKIEQVSAEPTLPTNSPTKTPTPPTSPTNTPPKTPTPPRSPSHSPSPSPKSSPPKSPPTADMTQRDQISMAARAKAEGKKKLFGSEVAVEEESDPLVAAIDAELAGSSQPAAKKPFKFFDPITAEVVCLELSQEELRAQAIELARLKRVSMDEMASAAEIEKTKAEEAKAYKKIADVREGRMDPTALQLKEIERIAAEKDTQRAEKAQKNKEQWEKYVRLMNFRLLPEPITDISWTLKDKRVELTVFRANNPFNFNIIKGASVDMFGVSEWMELLEVLKKKRKGRVHSDMMSALETLFQWKLSIEKKFRVDLSKPLADQGPQAEQKKRKRVAEGTSTLLAEESLPQRNLSVPAGVRFREGLVIRDPEFGMFFTNNAMMECFQRVNELHLCTTWQLFLLKGTCQRGSNDAEFISLIELELAPRDKEVKKLKKAKLEELNLC